MGHIKLQQKISDLHDLKIQFTEMDVTDDLENILSLSLNFAPLLSDCDLLLELRYLSQPRITLPKL